MIQISGGRPGGGFFSNIGCLIFGALFLIGAFYFLSWLYKMLWWASPVFLALALIINWKVVASTGRYFVNTLRRNPISGLLTLLLAVPVFPFITIFWFFGAMGSKRLEKMQQQFGQQFGGASFDPFQTASRKETEFVDFEEIESKPVHKNEDQTIPELPLEELPPTPKKEGKGPENPYDGIFS